MGFERITKRYPGGEAYFGIGGNIYTGRIANQLAAFEDICETHNTTPERLAELAKADAAGLLQVSTLKAGNKIYKLDGHGGIQEWDVCTVEVGGCMGETWLCDRDDGTEVYTFDLIDLKHGVVFRTRQEAEAVLEKEANG